MPRPVPSDGVFFRLLLDELAQEYDTLLQQVTGHTARGGNDANSASYRQPYHDMTRLDTNRGDLRLALKRIQKQRYMNDSGTMSSSVKFAQDETSALLVTSISDVGDAAATKANCPETSRNKFCTNSETVPVENSCADVAISDSCPSEARSDGKAKTVESGSQSQANDSQHEEAVLHKIGLISDKAPVRPTLFGMSSFEVGHAPKCLIAKNHRVAKTLDHILSKTPEISNEAIDASNSVFRRLVIDKIFLNSIVDGVTSVIIVINLVYVGVSSELENVRLLFILDVIFTIFFFLERLIKLHIFGLYLYTFGKERYWNLFETLMVVASLSELVAVVFGASADKSAELLRLIRLCRIAKILRVLRLRFFKELMMMVSGIVGGARTLLWSFVLIGIPLYMIAVGMRETAGRLHRGQDDATENFVDLSTSFYTMFRCLVAGDCTDKGGRPIFLMLATSHGWVYAVAYVITLLFMNFGLFNVIISIYVENTVAASKYNQLALKQHRLQSDEFFSNKTKELLELVAENSRSRPRTSGNMIDNKIMSWQISRDYFSKLCEIERFREVLCELDIAEEDQMDLFDTLDVDAGGSLDIEELIMGIAKLRGDPRRADVISIGLALRSMQHSSQQFEASVRRTLKAHHELLSYIKARC